jgi:hypothetical protein
MPKYILEAPKIPRKFLEMFWHLMNSIKIFGVFKSYLCDSNNWILLLRKRKKYRKLPKTSRHIKMILTCFAL